jgi:uncharacterized membrane protein
MCKAVREAAKRELGTQVLNRKEPLILEIFLAFVHLFAVRDAPLTVWSVFLAAVAMVCFAGFLRYNEAYRILVQDVCLYDIHMEVFVPTSCRA